MRRAVDKFRRGGLALWYCLSVAHLEIKAARRSTQDT